MLDNRRLYETPEGVDLEIIPAGPLPRVLAYLCDLLIRIALFLVLALILGQFGEAGRGLFLITYFLLEWFYPVIFEGFRGATPGKRWQNLRVVSTSALPLGWSGTVLRNLLRVVDFLPFLYTTGLIAMVMGSRFQRLGDLAAGALVVYTHELQATREPAKGQAEPLMLPLQAAEIQALRDYVQRSEQLSAERRQELAALLGPLLDCPPESAEARLQSAGRYYLGVAASP